MKISFSNRGARLGEVAAGSIVGLFEEGRYVRALKLAGSAPSGHVFLVSLGPFAEPDRPVTVYVPYDNEYVVDECSTEFSPIVTSDIGEPITPITPNRLNVGAVCLAVDGRTLLYVRRGDGQRAYVDVQSGEFAGATVKVAAAYRHYTLIGRDELGKAHILFDSSESEHFAKSEMSKSA